MGYTTDFYGQFEFNKPVEPWLIEYVNKFCETRRMKRDNEKIKELYPNWKDLCFNGELGTDGEYFVGGTGFYGQGRDQSILEYNRPASTQPELWCQWVVTEDGKYLEWDEGEKFYEYEEWLEYLIKNFFEPFGYVLNGDVEFQGEAYDDFGVISVVNNMVNINYGLRIASMDYVDDTTLIDELVKRGYKVIGNNHVEGK